MAVQTSNIVRPVDSVSIPLVTTVTSRVSRISRTPRVSPPPLAWLAPFVLVAILFATSLGTLTLARPAFSQESLTALGLLRLSIAEMQRQDSLLADYCYRKTVVMESLDGDFETRESEERLLEVTSVPRGEDIEVLVAVDGKPLSRKERDKYEAEQKKHAESGDRQFKVSSEDLLTQFEWSFAGHEDVNGRPATILSFSPKPDAVYSGNDCKVAKFIKQVTGRAWVDDEDHAISRIEFRSLGQVKSFGGLLWTVRSFFVREERRRLPEGLWIDSTGEYFVDASALLVKRITRRSVMRTHDYGRCSDSATPAHKSTSLIRDRDSSNP